jgi:hypothetical protein
MRFDNRESPEKFKDIVETVSGVAIVENPLEYDPDPLML